MHFKTTQTTAKLLDELNRLGVEIEPRLELVSAAARAEWRELRSRFPSDHDLRSGFTAVSDEELAIMCAKVNRFRGFLGGRRSIASRSVPSSAPASAAPTVGLGTLARH
jgi:hypothetical protein